MRSQGSLSHYLDKLGSEGSFDSSGGFTMLEINALEKLARYTLADKEDWLLKVVQAAVVARSKALDIKILRSTVEVRFDFPGGEEWEDVARSVVALSQSSGPFAEHLNIALRTLLSHHRFCLLSVHSGALFWDGHEVLAGYKPNLHITARTTVRATKNFFALGAAGGLLGLVATFTPLGGGVCFLLAGISGAVDEFRHGPDEIVDFKRLALAQKNCLSQQVLEVNARQSRE